MKNEKLKIFQDENFEIKTIEMNHMKKIIVQQTIEK